MAELQNYFIKAGDNRRTPSGTALGSEEETAPRGGEKRVEEGGAVQGCESGDDSLKLSIVETQPLDSLLHRAQAASSATEL